MLKMLLHPPFDPPQSCSLWHLSLRTVFLLAITSARRVSELHALSMKEPFMVFFPNRVLLHPVQTYLPKVSLEFHCNWEIELSSLGVVSGRESEHHWKKLDLVDSLKIYLERTQVLRKVDNLFILTSGVKTTCLVFLDCEDDSIGIQERGPVSSRPSAGSFHAGNGNVLGSFGESSYDNHL